MAKAKQTAGERIVKGELPPVSSVSQRLVFHYGRFKEDNASGFESNTLGTERPNYFLENRLWNAFMAGAAARDKIMEQDGQIKPAKHPQPTCERCGGLLRGHSGGGWIPCGCKPKPAKCRTCKGTGLANSGVPSMPMPCPKCKPAKSGTISAVMLPKTWGQMRMIKPAKCNRKKGKK